MGSTCDIIFVWRTKLCNTCHTWGISLVPRPVERFLAFEFEHLSAGSARTQLWNKFRKHSITFHFPREGRMQHVCLSPTPGLVAFVVPLFQQNRTENWSASCRGGRERTEQQAGRRALSSNSFIVGLPHLIEEIYLSSSLSTFSVAIQRQTPSNRSRTAGPRLAAPQCFAYSLFYVNRNGTTRATIVEFVLRNWSRVQSQVS